MKKILAAAFAALAFSGTAHADVAGPRCDVGGTSAVGSGGCLFGHPSFASVSVSASAVGVPGGASVHISIRHFDTATWTVGALVLECSDASTGLADPDAACAASVAYSGAGSFVCQIEGAIRFTGTCASTVTA